MNGEDFTPHSRAVERITCRTAKLFSYRVGFHIEWVFKTRSKPSYITCQKKGLTYNNCRGTNEMAEGIRRQRERWKTYFSFQRSGKGPAG